MAEYIEREDLIRRLKIRIQSWGRDCNSNAPTIMRTYKEVLSQVEHLLTADVEEVRHGQWLPEIVSGVKTWHCSECRTFGSPHWKRCPICETKMDAGKVE